MSVLNGLPANTKTLSAPNNAASPLAGMSAAQLAAAIQAQVAATVAAALAGQKPATITPPAAVPASVPAVTPATTLATPAAPQFSSLTAAQIAAMSLSQIEALTVAQLASLTPAQLAGLSAADIAALSPAQIASLGPNAVGALSRQQIGALAAPQLAALTKTQLNNLTASQLGSLSGAQIAGFSAAQINALSPSQLGGLNINYNSMLALLQTDAVGGMNAAKFSALQALAVKLNAPGGISVSTYLQQITDDVILGNAANATWTGGGAQAMPLGNLSASSTQGQADDLIGKWFLGTDLPGSVVNLAGAQPLSVTYAAVSSPLFGPAGPSMSDVNQGALGDCFVLAPLAEMASQDPSAIQSMITPNGNNSFSVRFTVDGAPDYITVNNELADGGKIFNSGPASWAGLIEQAYTELQGGGAVTGNTLSSGNSFTSIGNGGWAEATLEEFTGARTIDDFDASGASWTSDIINGASLSVPGKPSSATLQSSMSGLSGSAVQSTLAADLSAGDDLVLSSLTNAVDPSGKVTLVADHSLAVYGYDAKTKMFEVYNPWGTESGQYWDTTFEVSLNTLLSDGDTISVASNLPASGGSPGLPLTPVSTAGLMASVTSSLSGLMAGSASLSSLGLAAAG
jgi:Calpain family cysteine protease/ALTTAQ repeat